jgi:NAD(P)-dependent dehydrogenase (short-subunit alcohol dehydrogenase family)
MDSTDFFSLAGSVAVVIGGTGVLGSAIARGLAAAGAQVGVLGRRADAAADVVNAISERGGAALPLLADVLDEGQIEEAYTAVMEAWGRVDILVNAAGGNQPAATITGDLTFFTLSQEALHDIIELNLTSAIRSMQVFGEPMVEQGSGSIINISSLSGHRALTRVMGYGAAKAALESVTRWLAVEMARTYSPAIRVNAVAPGFFIGEQNRSLLLDASGELTERGSTIINHTPMGRFGEPDDLVGTVVWLAGDASRFVTGITVPIDGGFSAFSGV